MKHSSSMPGFSIHLLALIYAAFVASKVLFVFTQSGSATTPIDEILTVLMLPFAGVAIQRYWRRIWVLPTFFGIYAILGLISAYVSPFKGVSQPLAAIVDVVLDAKFAVLVLAGYFAFRRSGKPSVAFYQLCLVIVLFALVNLIFVVRDIFSTGTGIWGQLLAHRLGFWQPSGMFYSHVESTWLTMLGMLCAGYLAVRKKQYLWTLTFFALLIAVLAHFSVKEIIVSVSVVGLYFLHQKGQYRKAIAVLLVVPITIFLLAVTPVGSVIASQFSRYTGGESDSYARVALTNTSYRIAIDEFPLGSGAGTFASAPSYKFGYSDVYSAYGIDGLNGLSERKPNFITDVFWPKLLGQSGVFGLLSYSVLIGWILIGLYRRYLATRSPESAVCFYVLLSAVVISLASTPFNYESFMVPLAFICAYGLSIQIQPRERLEK